MDINIVSDQACPSCGAYWGHPDPDLDFPNRIKVDSDWRCYTPACDVGYYRNGKILEYEPSEEEEREIKERVAKEVKEGLATHGIRVSTVNADGSVTEEFIPPERFQ